MIKNTSQSFVQIREIRNGLIVLNDGNMRAILSSSSLNLSLKSEDEQVGIINGFQSFLNSLNFNVQFFITSKKLDVRNYISLLKERETEVKEDLLKIQIKEYIDFIQKFTEEQNIMTKGFYIIVPYDIPNLIGNAARMNDIEFTKNKSQLMQRVSIVISGLTNLGLKIEMSNTEEILDLFYKLYNPNELDTPNLSKE